MKQRRLQKSFAVLAAAGLLVAACGGDDDDSGSDAAEETAETGGDDTAEQTAEESAESAEESAESAEESADSGGDDTEPAEASGDVDTEVSETEETAVYGGNLNVGLEAESNGFRPWEDTCSVNCYNMNTTVYDKLMEQTVDGDYQGWLAEEIVPNDDFTVWTLTLRPGVVFHNGVELTAQSVADMFPIQQTGAQSSGQIASSGLTSVEATGDLEVTYTLSGQNAAFPAILSRSPLGMVWEAGAAGADPEGFGNQAIGTGPFMMEKRDLDNETVVVRNPSYWKTAPNGDQLPYLDSITFRPIPDEGTRVDALLSGTVDAIISLRQNTIRDLRDDGTKTLLEHQGSNVGGGMYNTAIAPFDDVRVRKALTQLNDQAAAIEALGGTGISLPGTQLWSPDSPWYSQAAADAFPKFDFEAGVTTLQEYVDDPARSDGKAPGEPIDVELSCPPDPTLIALMQVIEQTWTASGLVNVTLTNFDQQTHINNALSDNHQAHCWRFSDDNDPSTSVNAFLAPPDASPLNFPNWFNETAYSAALEAITTDDLAERQALYETISLEMAAEVPIWYSGYTATVIATAPEVMGVNGWHLPNGTIGVGFPGAEGRWSEAFLDG